MPITINGDGSITGLSVGGLGSGVVNTATLANGAATGAKLTLPSGSVIQTVHTTRTTSFTTTSQTYVDLMTATITPSSNTSKMLVRYGLSAGTDNDNMHIYSAMFRDSTEIGSATDTGSRTGAFSVHNTMDQSMVYGGGEHLDSPATNSAITYKIKVKSSNGGQANFNRSHRDHNSAAYDGRVSSFLTVMEVAV